MHQSITFRTSEFDGLSEFLSTTQETHWKPPVYDQNVVRTSPGLTNHGLEFEVEFVELYENSLTFMYVCNLPHCC